MAKLRVQDLDNRDFEIAKSDPPVLQGQPLTKALSKVGRVRVFVEFDRTIDGPQAAERLIRETMSKHGTIFVDSISDAKYAVWIGGTGAMHFAFVVLDASNFARYQCYLCGPRELTAAVMTTLANFVSTSNPAPSDRPATGRRRLWLAAIVLSLVVLGVWLASQVFQR